MQQSPGDYSYYSTYQMSVEWKKWPPLPVKTRNTQLVCLNGKVYVGGGYISGCLEDRLKLYSYNPRVDRKWKENKTPTFRYALVAYESQLLLVGGRTCPSTQRTNKIFTLGKRKFGETVPAMREKRESSSAVSKKSALVVAGGIGNSGPLSSVEVLEGGQWMTASSLPKPGFSMQSVLHNDHWYLFFNGNVFCMSLENLNSSDPLQWKTLQEIPCKFSAGVSLGGHLLSIGGTSENSVESSIFQFSPTSQDWENVGAQLPVPLMHLSASVLPNGELIIAAGEGEDGIRSGTVFSGVIKGWFQYLGCIV